jgi:hypothetical protein
MFKTNFCYLLFSTLYKFKVALLRNSYMWFLMHLFIGSKHFVSKIQGCQHHCNEHDRRQRAGFKRRAPQVFIVKYHRRRQVAGSRGRQKVIHRGPKGQQYRQGKG